MDDYLCSLSLSLLYIFGGYFSSFLIFIFSVLAKEIGWKEHLQNERFYVKLDVRLNSVNQSLTRCL